MFRLRGTSLIVAILACSGLDFCETNILLFGYDQGLFGGILTSEPFLETLGNPNPTMSGLITAIYDIGCALGAVAAYIWGDRLGRRNSIIYANIIVIVGAAIQTASFEYWQMFVSRIIAGVGVGLSTVAVPILQSETLPARSRGAMLVIQAVVVLIGVSSASWLCFAFLYTEASLQWRLPVAIQILFSGLVLVSTLFIPETPRWLASQNRVEEARNVIARLLDRPEDDEAVTGQLTEILDALATETEGEQAVGWLEVFSNRTKSRNLHRVLIGMGPYMMNQWSGTNALTYYLAYILREYLDFSQSLSLILASVAFTIYFLLAIPPYFYIDRIGRRWTIMLSSTGCAACMAIIAGCLIHRVYSNTVAAVAFMFLYLGVFAMGILPVSWSYSAEVQPLHCRSKATAVGVFSHWMSNFVVVMVTPIGLSSIGGHYFWIWAVVCASFVPLIWFFGVETAGRTLEQVDQMFYDNPRMLMGLNPENRRVWRPSKADEETHFRAVNEKVKNEDVSYIENMDVKR